MWKRLVEKITALRAHESSAANWNGISYAMKPPAGAAAVESFELNQDVRLPDDYREFLLQVGDGGAGPGYGLYSLEQSLAERGDGVWSLRDPFVAPLSAREWVDLRAPGMLLLHHDGCAYYTGLVVAGPERGTVWSYVEVQPGWVPVCSAAVTHADGKPYELEGSGSEHYARWYDVMLAPHNRRLRTSFTAHYEGWLDGILKAGTTS